MRLLLTLVGLAIIFALPTFAPMTTYQAFEFEKRHEVQFRLPVVGYVSNGSSLIVWSSKANALMKSLSWWSEKLLSVSEG